MKLSLPLYDPLVVEISGTAYKVKRINRATQRALTDFAAKADPKKPTAESVEEMYVLAEAFLDAPREVIDGLSPKEISEVIVFMFSQYGANAGAKPEDKKTEEAATPETPEEKENAEKNAPKPGDGTAA